MYKTIQYEANPPIVTITLDRPGVGNQINLDMASELRDALCSFQQDNCFQVAIITGNGPLFSAGRENLIIDPKIENPPTLLELIDLHRISPTFAKISKPVIAAINGDAIDQGLELALACDIRVASTEASLGFTDLIHNRIPWDGGTQRLPRIIGVGHAIDMILTSRLFDSRAALNMGLVNQVTKPQTVITCALDIASKICQGAPIASMYVKETIINGMDMTLAQGLKIEADLSILLQSTQDRKEGLQSFIEKRLPRFTGA